MNHHLDCSKKANRVARCLVAVLLLLLVAAASGCRTFTFYAQALKGQSQMLLHEKPIEELLANPQTAAPLKERFLVLKDLRAFAETELKLPANGHYRKYVDVHRPYVVWNVEAAPEFSMQPETWWYPLVGSLEYRGYFSLRGATNYARYLRKKGYDVAVGGVEAYSTLGWFKDPVLNTFIFEPDAELAEIIFHELGHQRVFARGDTDFNEAFATTVGQEGGRRWLKSKSDSAALEKYLAHLRHTREFSQLVMKSRSRLEALYGDERTEEGQIKASRKPRVMPAKALREQKETILKELKQEYARLKNGWGKDAEYDWWFTHQLNNAHLNSVAAYYDLVPGFERLLADNGGDLESFYTAAKRLAKEPKKKRHELLRQLAAKTMPPPQVSADLFDSSGQGDQLKNSGPLNKPVSGQAWR